MPIFPLGMVLFPTLPIRLQIFEERYIKMLQHCLVQNKNFGVVLIREGMEAHGDLAQIRTVGCSVQILELERLSEGRFNLYGMGDNRFRIIGEDRSGDFLYGSVEWMPFGKGHSEPIQNESEYDFPERIKIYIENLAPNRLPMLSKITFPEDLLDRAFIATEFLQISLSKKQSLLEIENRTDFIQEVAGALDHEINLLKTIKSLNYPSGDQSFQSLN